jgi:hypothetical protein
MKRLCLALVFMLLCALTTIGARTAFPQAPSKQSPEAQVASTRTALPEASQPPTVFVLKPEFVQACNEAIDRIMKEALKGLDAQFSPSDREASDVCGSAGDALAVSNSLITPSEALKVRVKSERIETARKTSARMVAEFNQNGTKASFSSSDTRWVSSFRNALVAVTALEKAESPIVKKNLKPELIEGAKREAEAIIAKVNEYGIAEVSYFEGIQLNEFMSKLKELEK